MDFTSLLNNFSGNNIIGLFFKAFAVLFTLMYLIYAIVISKQTQVMNNTLKVGTSGTFSLISSLQILAGIGLFLLAIFFI